MSATIPLNIEHDEAADTVTICGVRYSGYVFRSLGTAQPGTWLRIRERKDGALSLNTVSGQVEKTFDAIVGIKAAG